MGMHANAFSLVYYDTDDDNKFAADEAHEYIGTAGDIWYLWFLLTHTLQKRHVEVYNLRGTRLQPEKGINAMS
jgi:hypothetical protein